VFADRRLAAGSG